LHLNGQLFDGINDLAGHVSLADHAMTWAAQYALFAIVAIVALSWFARAGNSADRRIAVYTAIAAAAIGVLVAQAIQHVYVHQRPFVLRHGDVVLLLNHSADPSFPSEHSTAAFAMAAGIGVYRQRVGGVLLALAALVAFSRVYVGIHYPADVAAGAAIGVIIVLALRFARPALAWLDRTIVLRVVPAPLR
jgi:undecaprenyl-diphosphatase